MAGIEAQAEPLGRTDGVEEVGELLERAPERPARAGRVLEVQRAVLALAQRLGDELAGALDRRGDLAGQRAAGVQDTA